MKVNGLLVSVSLLCLIGAGMGQTRDAYEDSGEETGEGQSLLDPSRLSVNHSVSFGMSSSSAQAGLKSQSLYSTMLTYRFSTPVTLNLNFELPIHSTYSSGQNLNQENLQSLEYFRNMPLSAALTWQPRENLLLRFCVIRNTADCSRAQSFLPYAPANLLQGW